MGVLQVISVAIMAHQKRAAFIPELEARLDRPAEVVWDRKNDRWDTGRRALLTYDRSATHHLVLQDDALICRDLVAGVERALEHTPGDSPVCLYVGKVRPYKALVDEYTRDSERASWLVMAQINWGVAIVFPTKIIESMVAWCDNQDIPNYDSRMSRWFETRGISTWYPWPSLVDHRESPSLVPSRGHAGRVARRFAGEDVSALDIDWGGDVVKLPHPIPERFHRPGVSPMLFRSEKYPNYHVPNVRVTFEDGWAEVTNRSAISYLNGTFMRRRGIRPATPAEVEAYAARIAENVEEEVQEPQPPADDGQDSGDDDQTNGSQQEPEAKSEPTADGEHTGEPADLTSAVPDGTADDVMAWVDGDTERARAAVEVESGRSKPRKTLLTKLEALTGE